MHCYEKKLRKSSDSTCCYESEQIRDAENRIYQLNRYSLRVNKRHALKWKREVYSNNMLITRVRNVTTIIYVRI